MKYTQLKQHLQEQINPIYLATGQDTFLHDKTIAAFSKKCASDFDDINIQHFSWENFDAQNIINSCNGMPFAAQNKLVVLRQPGKLSKEDEKLFSAYAKNPNPSTCLLIVSDDKFFAGLPNVTIIDCSALTVDEQKMLIASTLKKQNKTITIDGAQLLIEKCENDAQKITNELTKLCFFADENMITKQHVEFVVANSFEQDIFGLTNALAVKNASTVLQILRSLLLAKSEPIQILSAIANNFRRMFLCSISTDMSQDELASTLGVKPYAIKIAKENAKKFGVKNLKRINELLTQTDYMLKSGQMSAINTVYYLIFNILTI